MTITPAYAAAEEPTSPDPRPGQPAAPERRRGVGRSGMMPMTVCETTAGVSSTPPKNPQCLRSAGVECKWPEAAGLSG